MNKVTSMFSCLLIVATVMGCGFLSSLGIVVKIDDVDTILKAETAISDVQNGTFAVANYDLNFTKSDLLVSEDLKKPSTDGQILIAFKVDHGAGGPDVESGKFNVENIKWMHVYYFKNGGLQQKALQDMTGSVILPNFRTNETEIPAALDIKDGNTTLKGAFSAKKLSK